MTWMEIGASTELWETWEMETGATAEEAASWDGREERASLIRERDGESSFPEDSDSERDESGGSWMVSRERIPEESDNRLFRKRNHPSRRTVILKGMNLEETG